MEDGLAVRWVRWVFGNFNAEDWTTPLSFRSSFHSQQRKRNEHIALGARHAESQTCGGVLDTANLP